MLLFLWASAVNLLAKVGNNSRKMPNCNHRPNIVYLVTFCRWLCALARQTKRLPHVNVTPSIVFSRKLSYSRLKSTKKQNRYLLFTLFTVSMEETGLSFEIYETRTISEFLFQFHKINIGLH